MTNLRNCYGIRRAGFLVLIITMMGKGIAQESSAKSAGEVKEVILGYFDQMTNTLSGADGKEMLGSVQLMLNEVSTEAFNDLIVRIKLFTGLEELKAALFRNELDIVGIRPLPYLELRETIDLEPSAALMLKNSYGMEYIILVHAGSGIMSVADLQGKNMIINTPNGPSIQSLWLENLVMKTKGSTIDRFFNTIQIEKKASKAVIPVFFKQFDACLISAGSFHILCELNPQLSQNLKVIAKSPPYLNGVVCLNKRLEPSLQQRILDILYNFNQNPKGQQILMLFQVNHIEPYQPEWMVNTLKLTEELEKIHSIKNE